MNIFNLMKRAGIGLGLLLIPSFLIITYQTADAAKTESAKVGKDKKSYQQGKNNNKSSMKASKEEIKVIQDMYKAFQDSISSSVTKDTVKSFYEKYFSHDIYKSFGIKKQDKESFDVLLIDYCVTVLKSNLGQIAKGYELSAEFSKLKKNKSTIIKCKLKKGNEAIDMSVILNKDKKIKDFSIMNAFQLIKGAKTVVEEYCRSNKNKEYKKLKPKEKLEMCQKAW